MIQPSLFLRRAIQADAIFSGVSAVLLTFGAAELAPWLNLPEALLRETGLFLIAYTALVGWLGTRQAMPKPLVLIVIAGNAAWTRRQHRVVVLERRDAEPAGRSLCRDAGHRRRRPWRIAIYRMAQKQRRAGRLGRGLPVRTSGRRESTRSSWRFLASRKFWALRRPISCRPLWAGHGRSGVCRSRACRSVRRSNGHSALPEAFFPAAFAAAFLWPSPPASRPFFKAFLSALAFRRSRSALASARFFLRFFSQASHLQPIGFR